jgi:hypothetical protein
VTGRKVRAPRRAYSRITLLPREIVMEVMLLLLDEIDDLCAMAWQRTLSFFER